MCVTFREPRAAKNHRSPSNWTSCIAIGRLMRVPSGATVVNRPNRSSESSSATSRVSSVVMPGCCPPRAIPTLPGCACSAVAASRPTSTVAVTVGGIELGRGRPAVPDPGFVEGDALPPALWVTDASVPDAAGAVVRELWFE